jgi:hypothetical protein
MATSIVELSAWSCAIGRVSAGTHSTRYAFMRMPKLM